MDTKALNAAIDAYEADLERPSHGRGTCTQMRASAREAAISAMNYPHLNRRLQMGYPRFTEAP